MALPSFFKRTASKAPAPPPDPLSDEAGPVQAARAQARRRLIGAVVLLAIGIIVFPMLFETQPRPLPHDIPIELPRREVAAPRAPAAPRLSPAVTELPVAEPEAAASAAEAPVVAEAAPVAPTATPVAPTATPESEKVGKAEKVEKVEKSSPPPSKPAVASAPASGADGKAGRFVVQVGAYTDANTLRDVRAKVEKLGLKTYTQSVDTDAGKRTRVRVGPFATRQEADGASSKLKGAGLPGNVLVL